MTTCLNQFSLKNMAYNPDLKYRLISKITICCDIDKNKLIDIIQFTFSQKSDLTVFGYNSKSQEFWAKKIIKNEFMLHVTLNIKSINSDNSKIIVTPIIGNDKEIKKLIIIITEMISLYKKFNYITRL
jgi:hypothetical protein